MLDFEKYMKKCFRLARKGEGKVSPNPLVGCVVLDKNGVEVATGYHKAYGEHHAERDALLKLKNNEAKGGTLIVNLEPCTHFGKTPPCADLIIEKGIKTLVVAMEDVNPIVAGKGIEKCKQAGIDVLTGVLESEAKALNEVFIKNMSRKETFVAIKTATTLDGKIATKNGSSKWITSEKARNEVKKIRNRYDALMTTSNTVIADNPSMDVPFKIILDRNLKTSFDMKIYKSGKIYVVVDENISLPKKPENVDFIKCSVKENKLDLQEVFKKLFELKIMSVLVESGGKLNGSIISQGLADKIYHFIAPKILADNEGLSSFDGLKIKDINNALDFKIQSVEMFSPDILVIYS